MRFYALLHTSCIIVTDGTAAATTLEEAEQIVHVETEENLGDRSPLPNPIPDCGFIRELTLPSHVCCLLPIDSYKYQAVIIGILTSIS